MNQHEKTYTFVLLFLTVVITVSLILMEQGSQTPYENIDYEWIIWTDKETYELGEQIQAYLIAVPQIEQSNQHSIAPPLTFSGKSIYDPKTRVSPFWASETIHLATYLETPIILSEEGNFTLIVANFTPTYPGPYEIRGLDAKKTVEVTGYKEVRLNDTGISLTIEPSIAKPKDRDYVEFTISILNENPYPVKIPVWSTIWLGFEQDELQPSVKPSWLYPFIKIEPESRYIVEPSLGYQVRYPSFTLYVSINRVMASIELEVEQ